MDLIQISIQRKIPQVNLNGIVMPDLLDLVPDSQEALITENGFVITTEDGKIIVK